MTSNDLFKLFYEYYLPAKEIVEKKFLLFSPEQLNHKPSPGEWSAGECFEHLLQTNGLYVPIFNEVLNNIKLEQINSDAEYKHSFIGRMIIKTVDPEQRKKYKSPKAFQITVNEVSKDIIQQFLEHYELLLTIIKKFEGADLTKVKIVSPASKFVRYNMGDCLLIIAYHNKRHILQAERAVNNFSNQK